MKKPKQPPAVSVIIPVLGEEAGINPCLRQVRETAAGEPVEIIVVDGDPDSGTVKRIDDGDVIALRSPKGRGAQMNRGAASAKGSVLLFLHADTILPPDAFRLIRDALADPRVTGGAFDLAIDSPRPLLLLTARCASLKHRITRVPYGDQAIFIRRDFFKAAGGYREIPLFEDVDMMKRIKRLDGKIIILPERVRTSARKWERDGILYAIFRNWFLQVLHLMGVSPEFLVRRYYRE